MDEAEARQEEIPVGIPEIERLGLQNLFLQLTVYREQLNNLISQLLISPQPRKLQDKIDEITAEINARAQEVFSSAGVNPKEFKFDVNRGTFIRRTPDEE
jgi:phosphoribosylaminoimidazole-succinocarboxamide synthase